MDTVALLNLPLLPSRKTAKLIFSGAAPEHRSHRLMVPMFARLCIQRTSESLVGSVCDWPTRARLMLAFALQRLASDLTGGTDLTLFKQHPLVPHCWNTSAIRSVTRR
jgi:hypothetical protein